ncbi:MAG: hypothetical protein ACREQJ_08885 [Candidatus Binatia bacterium]
MSDSYRQQLFAILSDGKMLFPLFVEVRKDAATVDLDYLKRQVAEQYGTDLGELRIVSHPRWAIRRDTPDGHVVHLGMIPADSPAADS